MVDRSEEFEVWGIEGVVLWECELDFEFTALEVRPVEQFFGERSRRGDRKGKYEGLRDGYLVGGVLGT